MHPRATCSISVVQRDAGRATRPRSYGFMQLGRALSWDSSSTFKYLMLYIGWTPGQGPFFLTIIQSYRTARKRLYHTVHSPPPPSPRLPNFSACCHMRCAFFSPLLKYDSSSGTSPVSYFHAVSLFLTEPRAACMLPVNFLTSRHSCRRKTRITAPQTGTSPAFDSCLLIR
jgi:hypothetical protein